MKLLLGSYKMAKPEEVDHGHLLHKVCKLLINRPDTKKWTGEHGKHGPVMIAHPLVRGMLVRVVMVSRFGDCGITDNLLAESGYIARVKPEHLEVQ